MKRITRRTILATGAGALLAARPQPAAAAWPEKPIQLIHGFAAGGNADVISRIIAEGLSTRLGQPVVVEPKPGAGGRIATTQLSKAAPDGYQIAVIAGAHPITAAMYEGLPYDTVNDFSFISMLTDFPFFIVTYPDHPVKTIADLIARSKAGGNPMIYGTAGNGTGQHLAGALFCAMAGINMQHLPFRGGAPGSTEILSKNIDFLFDGPTLLLELVKSGQIRAIAVTGKQRFFALPDVPTIGETVPGYETTSWLGLAAPKGMPAEILTRLNTEIRAVLAEPKVIERFRALGNVPAATSPADFKARVVTDIAKWTKVVADAGIKKLSAQ